VAELSKAIARLMQERERDPYAPEIGDPKTRALIDLVRGNVAPGERSFADVFARHWCDRCGEAWLASGRPSDLAAAVVMAFRFLAERSQDEVRVSVVDPDLTPGGWEMGGTVVHTLTQDRPFIVDTVRETLRAAGCTVLRLYHPIFSVERDARGGITGLAPGGHVGRQESLIHAEIERVAQPDLVAERLRENLTDLHHATEDYQAMRARAAELAELLRVRTLPTPWNEDAEEVAALLDWLRGKSFVFLGYREYQFSGQGLERAAVVRPGRGLGLLRNEGRSSYAQPRVLSNDLRRRLNEPPLLIVSKTNATSTVHRRAHMDYIGVKEVDSVGVVVGERRFIGLFTAKAYQEEPTDVPLLRGKLAQIVAAEGAIEESHDHKAIVTTFNTIPKVELLATPVPDLHTEIRTILSAEDISGREGSEVVVVQRPDTIGRGVFVVVIVPRERFSEELYRLTEARLALMLSATAVLEQRLVRHEASSQVRMHFYFAAPVDSVGTVPTSELRARIAGLLRTWDDRLRDELLSHFPRQRARELADRYGEALSGAYKSSTDVAIAARDIGALEALAATRLPQVEILNDEADRRFSTIRFYLLDEDLVLSDFLPVLENLGLRVFAQDAMTVPLAGIGTARVHAFQVQDALGLRLDVDATAPLLVPALVNLHAGRADNDPLNALILRAGIDWRAVDLLRTYGHYAVQIGVAASRTALFEVLTQYSEPARLLWSYFEHKFDPLKPTAPADRLQRGLPEIERQFVASLENVESVAADRILRAVFAVVAATVRTTFFIARSSAVRGEPNETGVTSERPTIAIKLDCEQIPSLPKPHPRFEIFVHAAHVEGVHLRSARVARGGIRLSDRPDDFRTEVLGLMQTQTIKNAVIVPAGAKGGFVIKRKPGAALLPAQIVAGYRTFISALLDLTDNIAQGRLSPPPGLLTYDESDPYLVVAADKGTASFSDTANEIAKQRQFWLGDAFASGGTQGYDHKKEGITARGAWECVKEHFRALGRDAEREPITVIGIGDMSGDVFGNGMLLSRRLLLRAAFNHAHVFVDPNPDAARSYTERERLFYLPRSAWTDYAPAALGPGGGIYPRNAKRVPLSPDARAMLGFEGPDPSGEEVVRAILRLDADLLWNGGIGTYVKASEEKHPEAGDPANDAVRIDASELRVKVVGEGGNLGFTQRARVEFAMRGGRINTDAIDNSAGVDMSDHEVNLKIALAGAVEGGQIRPVERDQVLRDLTGEVAQRVLDHNLRQARVLGFDQRRSQTQVAEYRELIAQLEHDGGLDRMLQRLPDRQALRERRGLMLGLTRPELAVLLAHVKLYLQRQLLQSALPDDPHFESGLRAYFPDSFNLRFGQGVRSHRLRREIIAVELSNRLVDTAGMTFAARIARDSGADVVGIARMWTVATNVGGWLDVHQDLVGADPLLPATAVAQGWEILVTALERAVKWFLETQPIDTDCADLIATFASPVMEVLELLPEVMAPAMLDVRQTALDELGRHGTPRVLAERLLAQERLADALEISNLAAEVGLTRRLTAEVYYRVAELVDLEWIRTALESVTAEDRWEQRAVESLHAGLNGARRELTREVLACGTTVEQCLAEYAAINDGGIKRLAGLVDDVKSARTPSLAAFLVVIGELNRLARPNP